MACIVIAGYGLGRIWNYRQFSLAILALSLCFLSFSLQAELRYRAFLTNPSDYRFSGIVHPAKRIWLLLTFASWHSQYVGGGVPPAADRTPPATADTIVNRGLE